MLSVSWSKVDLNHSACSWEIVNGAPVVGKGDGWGGDRGRGLGEGVDEALVRVVEREPARAGDGLSGLVVGTDLPVEVTRPLGVAHERELVELAAPDRLLRVRRERDVEDREGTRGDVARRLRRAAPAVVLEHLVTVGAGGPPRYPDRRRRWWAGPVRADGTVLAPAAGVVVVQTHRHADVLVVLRGSEGLLEGEAAGAARTEHLGGRVADLHLHHARVAVARAGDGPRHRLAVEGRRTDVVEHALQATVGLDVDHRAEGAPGRGLLVAHPQLHGEGPFVAGHLDPSGVGAGLLLDRPVHPSGHQDLHLAHRAARLRNRVLELDLLAGAGGNGGEGSPLGRTTDRL